jgi:hypothetical protein
MFEDLDRIQRHIRTLGGVWDGKAVVANPLVNLMCRQQVAPLTRTKESKVA